MANRIKINGLPLAFNYTIEEQQVKSETSDGNLLHRSVDSPLPPEAIFSCVRQNGENMELHVTFRNGDSVARDFITRRNDGGATGRSGDIQPGNIGITRTAYEQNWLGYINQASQGFRTILWSQSAAGNLHGPKTLQNNFGVNEIIPRHPSFNANNPNNDFSFHPCSTIGLSKETNNSIRIRVRHYRNTPGTLNIRVINYNNESDYQDFKTPISAASDNSFFGRVELVTQALRPALSSGDVIVEAWITGITEEPRLPDRQTYRNLPIGTTPDNELPGQDLKINADISRNNDYNIVLNSINLVSPSSLNNISRVWWQIVVDGKEVDSRTTAVPYINETILLNNSQLTNIWHGVRIRVWIAYNTNASINRPTSNWGLGRHMETMVHDFPLELPAIDNRINILLWSACNWSSSTNLWTSYAVNNNSGRRVRFDLFIEGQDFGLRTIEPHSSIFVDHASGNEWSVTNDNDLETALYATNHEIRNLEFEVAPGRWVRAAQTTFTANNSWIHVCLIPE